MQWTERREGKEVTLQRGGGKKREEGKFELLHSNKTVLHGVGNKMLKILFPCIVLIASSVNSNGCDKEFGSENNDLCVVKKSSGLNKEQQQHSWPSKAVRQVRGRLGNHLAGYMMALTFSMR